ncbi:hypothetical protein OESDEN_19791 [Oesophagostomum dentatum]|uniref:Secreted protein n=1 Tax=Oesophagostomum dentatum TaxID=61180 RepID=A0A0B1S597_OESDE|nr:hypothetical protein OESDEN_19791 [Oesophagostomum dentatum]
MNALWLYLATLQAAVFVVYSQSESSSQFGKPCTSSYQCWRTEPISDNGSPISLIAPARTKKLEITSKSRGARCRCIEDTCRMFVFTTGAYLPCEEF